MPVEKSAGRTTSVDRGHHGFRGKAFIGVAPLFLWGPSYIFSPPPAYPPVDYWYYCPSARAYYPYVTACPEPWVLVPAR